MLKANNGFAEKSAPPPSELGPGGDFLTNNATVWWRSSGLSSGIQEWVSEINAADILTLGSTNSVQTSDPAYVFGSPETLRFDGTDDFMQVSPTSTRLRPEISGGSGTFSVIVSGIWDTTANGSGRYVVVFQQAESVTHFWGLRTGTATTLHSFLVTSAGVSQTPNLTVEDGEKYTAAMVMDGTSMALYLVRDSGAVVPATVIRNAGTIDSLARLNVNTYSGAGGSPVGLRHTENLANIAGFQNIAITSENVQDIHTAVFSL